MSNPDQGQAPFDNQRGRIGQTVYYTRKTLEGSALYVASKLRGRAWRKNLSGVVFVASTGRSGTMTLGRILESVPDSIAVHQPYPILAGRYANAYNMGDEAPMRRNFRVRKVPEILRMARGKRWYAETSQVFIKGYAEFAVREFGDRLRVIHLVREADSVAASYFRQSTIPGGYRERHYAWLLDPDTPRNLIQIADEMSPGARFDHDFLRCLWYWYETEARTKRFHQDYPEVPLHRIETSQLNNLEDVKQMLDALGLPISPDLDEIVGVRANASPRRPQIPEDVGSQRLAEFHELCRQRLTEV